MKTRDTYLNQLVNKVFKLLPMREEYDRGVNNFLYQHLEYLNTNLDGAFVIYPEFCSNGYMVEVRVNLTKLMSDDSVSFAKWRSIVLRSASLIHNAIDQYREADDD